MLGDIKGNLDAVTDLQKKNGNSEEYLAKNPITQINSHAIDQLHPLQEHVSYPKWIAFDLDDTLHDFKHASQTAINHVFKLIQYDNPNIQTNELQSAYQKICKSLVTPFVDGRQSHEYRMERFSLLLDTLHLSKDPLASYIDGYEYSFNQAITPYEGAIELLSALNNKTQIAVISEGPHDAQERTLDTAKMKPYVKALITSNRERVSKKDGLFQRFMEQENLKPEDLLVIGDSLESDILPSNKLGIKSILFDPNRKHQNGAPQIRAEHLSQILSVIEKIVDFDK